MVFWRYLRQEVQCGTQCRVCIVFEMEGILHLTKLVPFSYGLSIHRTCPPITYAFFFEDISRSKTLKGRVPPF